MYYVIFENLRVNFSDNTALLTFKPKTVFKNMS